MFHRRISFFFFFFWLTRLFSFGEHYYPHEMFLQPVTSLLDLRAGSPLPFWAIIMVSSQGHDRYATVYHEVATEIEEILSPILQKAIQKIEIIRALVLLSKYFRIPAWSYIGLAVGQNLTLCLRVG